MVNYPKRLIEVDLPIKRISEHARREKSIRHGHISTLHVWWARRPLAACRAVICAALWPDPADELCPQSFRDVATQAINAFAQKTMADKKMGETASEHSMGRWNALTKQPLEAGNPEHWNVLRYALLDFIADFANWDNSTNKGYLETSRTLTQAAHEALDGLPGTRPLVVDPFAGGGAIPLEALRVGADAFASDLNPVAVLLNKVVIEYIPKYGQRLADEVREWGQWVKEQAEKDLAEFYPKDPDGATPIAYLWARTIICEGPRCGAEVPLIRSLWLAKRNKGGVALRLAPNPAMKQVDFEIIENATVKDVGEGTVALGSATCPCCEYTTPVESVRNQLTQKHGGAADARLFSVVLTYPDRSGRFYRNALNEEQDAAFEALKALNKLEEQYEGPISLLPNEPTPPDGTGSKGGGYRTRKYGIFTFVDFFTPRQQLEHLTFQKTIREAFELIQRDSQDDEFAQAILVCLALIADKQIERDSAFCRWISQTEAVGYTFGRQAIPMLWDFVESPGIYSSGGWSGITKDFVETLSFQTGALGDCASGTVVQTSATNNPLPNDFADGFFTDPPYYDSVPYGELSDFLYVWLRRTLNGHSILKTADALTPKEKECVVNLLENKDRDYFYQTMTEALEEAHRTLKPSGLGIIVFAHKSTSGWEAQIQAILDAKWTIVGSWPVDTERPGRLRAIGAAALASSIHIVCRPRETNAVGDWRDVLQELPGRIHAWLPRLAREGIVGADAIFACLGPALELFSRYARVEKASGEVINLNEYLEYVWAAVSREALNMVFAGADTTGFEEDARLTAMWLWTLSANGDDEATADKVVASAGYTLEYDAARKIAQGLGAHLEQLGHLVEVKGSKARLLPVAERTKYLFGKEDVKTTSRSRKQESGAQQLSLLEQLPEEAAAEWRLDEQAVSQVGRTVLDRTHQVMLLFASGRSDVLKRFLVADGVGQDESFWRLAQALSALYPANTDEKRWVDGVLARKKGLGF